MAKKVSPEMGFEPTTVGYSPELKIRSPTLYPLSYTGCA